MVDRLVDDAAMKIPRPLFLIAFSLALTACATSGVNKGDFNLISLSEEWQLGEGLSREIAGELTLLDDPRAVGWLQELGQRIVVRTEMADLPFAFHVVLDSTVNAFAIPGGHVYFQTGLLLQAETASEVAGVMGHEISHVVARHGTESLSRQYGVGILASLVLGQNPALLTRLVANIVATGAFMKFSRNAESEADRLGLQFMYAAGYDPEGMASFFERLLDLRKNKPNVIERFFSSHPLTEDRIATTRERIATLEPRTGVIAQDPEFLAVQDRLRSLLPSSP